TRDIDLAVAVSSSNLERLQAALRDLGAEPIYFPHLSARALRRGHACHFRCRRRDLEGLRIDVMYRMRGVAPFVQLWKRRQEIHVSGVGKVALLSLPDLVQAKKTQRDKDWPMIRRLVDADVARAGGRAEPSRVVFWLKECRTYDVLRELGRLYPRLAHRVAAQRPALRAALRGEARKAEALLHLEEQTERDRDRRYWAPLRSELERWRLGRWRLPR
ncbi:MAG: hypothetical protein ACK44W_10470, partial [Planctomycetota bacterium]